MGLEKVRKFVVELYSELERLSGKYEELVDTDVREAIHLTLNYCFVWGMTLDEFPTSYFMWSPEGNAAVAHAIERFLRAAGGCHEASQIPLGKARLDILQDRSIRTPGGEQYDLFIGHVDEPLPPSPLPQRMFGVRGT